MSNEEVVNLENQIKPNLWNPNAAANWSLLFSPILGAWLHAKNWEELNEPEAAKKSMLWVYAGFVFLLVVPFLPDEVGRSLGLIFILAWYFSSGKKQVKFIREKAIEYRKKSWNKPLLIGVIGLAAYCLYCFGLSPADNSAVDRVKGGIFGEYKDRTLGEAFDNYSPFKSTSWKSFKNEDDSQVVQCTGNLKISQHDRNNGISKASFIFQFILHKDDTFELADARMEVVEKGKKTSIDASSGAGVLIFKIYMNEVIFPN